MNSQDSDDQVLISSLLALAGESRSNPANVYLCGECSGEFLSAEDCEKHVALEHHKGPKGHLELKCEHKGCTYTFKTKDHLKIHLQCHRESGFQCFHCPEKDFKKWKKCSLHLWRHHQLDLDLLSCPLCPNVRVAHQHELEVHKQIHGERKKYVCSVCYKGFRQLSQFRNHAVTHMDKSKETVPSWFARKQCDLCQKSFADSKCLKKHVQAVHSRLKPYICQVCNHQCARKSMLEMHMRQHTGEKPFKCPECDYQTGDHNSLRRHKMRHSGDKPYKCQLCPYASIQSATFKRHMKNKHK